LEAMVVLPIDQSDLNRHAAQSFCGFDSGESRANDNDLCPFT